MARARKRKALTAAQKKLCPYGSNQCRLCSMKPVDIKHINYLRFEEKVTLKSLLKIIKEDYGMSLSYNQLCDHFNKHLVTVNKAMLKAGNKKSGGGLVDKKIAKVAEVLSPVVSQNVRVNDRLETAYSALVQMTQDYVGILDKLKGFVDQKFSDKKQLEKELDGVNAIKLLTAYTGFHRELRAQISDINNLRAPKILMIQFLEVTVKKLVEEMSNIFAMLCSSIQENVSHDLRKMGVTEGVNDKLFSPIFQKVAAEYQTKMTEIVRDQLFDAKVALAELSKIQ